MNFEFKEHPYLQTTICPELTILRRQNSIINYFSKYYPVSFEDLLNFEETELYNTNDSKNVPWARCNQFEHITSRSIIFLSNLEAPDEKTYIFLRISKSNTLVCIPKEYFKKFFHVFENYIESSSGLFTFDNLIHLVMIVKNSGEMITNCLNHVKKFIDEWTILDTGSTDGTQTRIRNSLAGIRGKLYEEPFINFRDSRNRAFELAGKSCVYNLVIDDSYYLKGGDNLREMLSAYRNNLSARSFSLKINSKTCSYDSCRITRSDLELRYVFRVHEFINDIKPSLVLPKELTFLWDQDSPYMKERTRSRMNQDLILLKEDLEEQPENPRNLFYIGQTYAGLEEWEKSIEWYEKRILNKDGFDEEIYNSMFRIGIIAELKLNWDWERVHQLYLRAFNNRPHRAEPLILIADYYYRKGCKDIAYLYAKRAFEIPFPFKEGLFVEKSYYDFELPNLLTKLCFEFKDYELGIDSAKKALKYTQNKEFEEWIFIHEKLKHISTLNPEKRYQQYSKPVLCIVTDGNYFPWNGNTAHTKGLGGSETSAVRFGEEMSKRGYKVFIFCKCKDDNIDLQGRVNNVTYKSIENYPEFVSKYNIDICIILRYNIYLPLSYHKNVNKIYLWLQDITPCNNILIINEQVKGILCLTKWHAERFAMLFPWVNKDIILTTTNAIDLEDFKHPTIVPYKFIYSSFPNRGLIHLLKMFPSIVKKYPQAHLDIFCNLELTDVYKRMGELDKIQEIKKLIQEQQEHVTNHGWVAKPTLREYFLQADIWLYTCDFEETSCITALEACASKTIPICTNLAALNENTGPSGILIPGNPSSKGWWSIALNELDLLFQDKDRQESIRESNFEWIKKYKTYSKVADKWTKLFQ